MYHTNEIISDAIFSPPGTSAAGIYQPLSWRRENEVLTRNLEQEFLHYPKFGRLGFSTDVSELMKDD